MIAFGAVGALVLLTQLVAGHVEGSALKIKQQKTDLAFRISATGQLASLRADSDKAKPLFRALNAVLPLKDDLINFGQSLIQAGKNNNMVLGFTFGGETVPKGELPGFISFSTSGTGSYENIQNFLKDIERSRYFVKFNSLDIIRQGTTNSYSLTADGQVFYQ